MRLADVILEAAANGCSVEFWNNHGVINVEVRKRTGGEVRTCDRGIGAYELTHVAGTDFVLADAVRSLSLRVLAVLP